MAAAEGLVFGGVDLNNVAGDYVLIDGSLSMPPPPKRPQWAQSADADGAELVRDPLSDNRTITFHVRVNRVRVNPAATMDDILGVIGALSDKIEECERQQDGLPLVWTPAGSTRSTTFQVLTGSVDDVPIAVAGEDKGWFRLYPKVKVTLTCRPFGLGAEIAGYTDSFSSNTIGNYTVDTGAANMAVSGGTLAPTGGLTSRNDLVQTAYAYLLGAARATVKAHVGATVTNYRAGVIPKWVAAQQYVAIEVTDNGTSTTLQIVLQQTGSGGSRASKATATAGARLTAGSDRWVRSRMEGNTIFAQLWSSAPTATGTPDLTASYTLAGADAAQFGEGVMGRQGVTISPQDAAAYLDDFTVEPYVVVSSQPDATVTLPHVPGDVPALARLVVTDSAGQARRHLEWGLEQRFYDPATVLRIDSAGLTIIGFAGTFATRSGSFNTNVIRGSLIPRSVAVLGTGNQPHVGTFRVKARVYASSGSVLARLSWQDGDGPFRANGWTSAPLAAAWCEIDLGTITIDQASAGTQQRWTGRIEAYSAATGDTLDVDYLFLIPAGEGYGKASGSYTYQPGDAVGFDDFATIPAGFNLNGRVAPVGGMWSAPTTTTFSGQAATIQRTAQSDLSLVIATLGTTTFTDVEVAVDTFASAYPTSSPNLQQAAIGRYVDASNYVFAALVPVMQSHASTLQLIYMLAGTTQTLATSAPFTALPGRWYTLRAVIFASGQFIGQALDSSGTLVEQATASSSVLATGGALASGHAGFGDALFAAGTFTRNYDNFAASIPAAEPIVMYAGRTATISSTDAVRGDASGTYSGKVPAYRGSRLRVPPAGDQARTSRLLVKARRNDVDVGSDDAVTDSTTAAVYITPRYAVVPRP